MADTKISALTQLAATDTQADDLLVIVDVHDTTMAGTGTDKKITVSDLTAAQQGSDLLMAASWFLP